MDIFDLIGPIMVGPSSSHTAGAARIGLIARKLLGEEPRKAELYLHGSFAATYKGHGTDKALIAGILGMSADDERIPDSLSIARQRNLEYSIRCIELRKAHPNSVLLKLTGCSGAMLQITAASVGGGRIEIRKIGDMELCFSADCPTLIVQNEDQPGSVADVSRILAELSINIGTFQVNRSSRGGEAIMIIECDEVLDPAIAQRISTIPGILKAVCINP